MTNLLPGVALWRSGRKKLGGILGGLVVVLVFLAAVLLSSPLYAEEMSRIRISAQDESFYDPDMNSVRVAWNTTFTTISYAVPLFFAWFIWGTSLWHSSSQVRPKVKSYGEMFLVSVLSPGFLEKTDGSIISAKRTRLSWIIGVGYFATALAVFQIVLIWPGDQLSSFEPLAAFILIPRYFWAIFLLGILCVTISSSRKAALKYSKERP